MPPFPALALRVLAPLALAGAAAGCRSTLCDVPGDGVCHILLEQSHAWHSGPAIVATSVVFVPLLLVSSPLFLLDPEAGNTHTSSLFHGVLIVSMVPGAIVGGAFYVALYPLEWVFPAPPATAPARTRVPPDAAPPEPGSAPAAPTGFSRDAAVVICHDI